MNGREANELAARVDLLWPNRQTHNMAALQAAVWADAMSDIHIDEAVAAVLDLARSGAKFAPSVGEIIDTVLTLRAERDGNVPPGIDQALTIITGAVARRGRARPPAPELWPHPAIADTVAAIGWVSLCSADNAEVLRAQIIRIYESARTRWLRSNRRSERIDALMSGTAVTAISNGRSVALPSFAGVE